MSNRLDQLLTMYDGDQDDPFLAYGIGLEYAKNEQIDEAIHWLDRTLEIDPRYCYAYFQKARMFSLAGDDAAAREILLLGIEAARQAGDNHAESEMSELMASLGE